MSSDLPDLRPAHRYCIVIFMIRGNWFYLLLAVLLCAAAARADHPYGIDQRPAFAAYVDGKLPAKAIVQTGNWTTIEAFPNLSFEDPTCLVPEPRSNRLYVSGRQGKIHWFVNDPTTTEKTEFLDLEPVTQGWDDCGLLAFAFHPEFGKTDSPNRGYVYVWYHYSPSPVPGPKRPPVNTPGYNRLSRFTVPDGTHVADRDSEQVLINQFDHNLWHEGSGMFFGQDGFLYLTVADEGASYDSFKNTQTIRGKLFSGMLRIDVDCDSKRSHAIRRQPTQEEKLPDGWTENNYTAHYFIPNDNPWLDPDGGVLEEFWAVGLRNTHRATQDPETGRIWGGDVGQDRWEEIDIIERSGNYQWVYLEGFHPTVQNGVAKQKPPPEEYIGTEKPPIYDYAHGMEGNCIIGGYVYRGKKYANELGGKYIFGDNGSGRIWSATWDGEHPPKVEYLCNAPPGSSYTGLSSFGVDHENELYICKMGRPSKILKLMPAEQAAKKTSVTFSAPERLSWLAAFSDLEKLTPIDGFIPYDVNTPLWSDGALKQRWIGVPSGVQVKFSPSGSWTFPDGTVFVKNFELVTNEATGKKKRLETRFLVRQEGGGVYGVTYKWRDNNKDADLVSNPRTETFDIKTADGGARKQTWYFPGPMDCLTCHNPNANDVLGVNTRQMNRELKYSGDVSDNQLRTLNHIGLFDRALDEAEVAKMAALVRVDDKNAPLEARVRSYLDANCAQCHRPNGAAGYFDGRYDTPLAEQGILNGRLAKQLDMPDARVVCPGDLSNSMLVRRVKLKGDNQMPPLARNVVDDEAEKLLSEWIESLSLPAK